MLKFQNDYSYDNSCNFSCNSMETETVKLLKALPNMLWKVMPMVVVATKYSQGKKDLRDPHTMVPFGFEFGFYYLYSCAVPLGSHHIIPMINVDIFFY